MYREVYYRGKNAPPMISVTYPPGFRGDRTISREDGNRFIATPSPTILSDDEITLLEAELQKLSNQIKLMFTSNVIVGDDPLYNASHEQIDRIEAENGYPSSRKDPKGRQRTIQNRVLILRCDRGYTE